MILPQNVVVALRTAILGKQGGQSVGPSLWERLARGAFWSVSSALTARGFVLLASFPIARILGRQQYGEFGVIQSTVGTVGVFASLGLGLTMTKHIAEWRAKDPGVVGGIVRLGSWLAHLSGAALFGLLFFSSSWLAQHALQAPHLADLIRMGALVAFFEAGNAFQTGCLTGLEAFRKLARLSLFSGLVSLPLLVAGVWWGGLRGTITAWVFVSGFRWLLTGFALRAQMANPSFRGTSGRTWKKQRELIAFSFPALLNGTLGVPVMWLANAILVNTPNGYSEMGLFAVANQWRVATLFLPGTVSAALLPILSSFTSTDREARPRLLSKLVLVNIGLAAMVALPVILLSGAILSGYGTQFEGDASVVIIMVLTSVVFAGASVLSRQLISTGRIWRELLSTCLWAICYLTLSFWLAPQLGARGLAIAWLAGVLVQGLYQWSTARSSNAVGLCPTAN